MSNDKSLLIRINGDAEGLLKEFNNIKKETQTLQDGLSSIAKNSAIAFAGLSAAITLTISSFRSAEQAQLRTEAVIKSTGAAAGITAEEITKMASGFEAVTTFADDTIQSGQNLLLTFTNIGKDIFPQATEAMLNMSTALGQDLSSSAIQLGKALNDPIQGVSALSRVGVQFTDAQKEVIKNLVETNRVAEAQAIILKELEKQMGGAARAAANGTGVFFQLKNSFDNLFESIGKGAFETLEPFIKKIKEVIDELRKNEPLLELTGKILVFGAAITGLIAILASLGVGLFTLRAAFLALGVIASPIGIAVIAIGTAAIYAATHLEALNAVVTAIQAAWQVASNFITTASNNVKIAFNELQVQAKELRLSMLEAIPGDFYVAEIAKIRAEISSLQDANNALMESNNAVGKSFDQIYDEISAEKMKEKLDAEAAAAFEARERALQAELDQREAHNATKLAQQQAYNEAANVSATAQAEIDKAQQELNAIKDLQFLKERDVIRQVQLKQHIEAMKKIRDKGLSEEKLQENKTNDEIREAKEKFRQDELKFQKKFGQDSLDAAASLGSKLFGQSSGLAKSLFLLSKGQALAEIAINTSRAATAALAFPPGPPISYAYVAGAVAAGAVQAANVVSTVFTGASDGALVGDNSGGFALGDRHPFMLERGELVVPRRNFDEVIEATARSRGMIAGQETNAGNGNSVTVHIDMSENAAQFITARQYENSRLGIDRA